MAQSFYCSKCQVLVDASEVDSEQLEADDKIVAEVYYHTLLVALTIGGETKSITHPVVPE